MNATSPLLQLKRDIKSQVPLSEDGQMKVKYLLSASTHMENDFTQSKLLKRQLEEYHHLPSEKRLRTQELAVYTKRKTLKGKSKTCKPTSQTTKFSTTSGLGLTSNAKDCKPFWNLQCQDNSKKLWLCTGIDSQDSGSNCLNPSSLRLAQNSWFSAKILQTPTENLPKTYSQLQPSLWRVTTGPEVPLIEKDVKPNEKLPAGKARKIRVYPTKEQQKTFHKWIGTTRWTYNQCVASIKTKVCRASKKELRSLHLNKDAVEESNPWVLETPYDVRNEGMNDVLKAIKSNLAAKREKFNLKYRSRKDPVQSVVVHSKHWGKDRGMFSGVLGSKVLKSSEPLPESLEYDSRLIRTRWGEWFLCLPLPLSVSENQAPRDDVWGNGVISLDPGVRTFVTGYDPSGVLCEWGKGDICRIYRLCYVLDSLQSRWTQKGVRHRKRYRLRKAANRIRTKVRNLVDEFHKKLAKWLCENYRVVLLPEFKTSGMIRRGQRKIGSKTARAMVTWSHYRFRQRLISKSREYPWCKIVVCDESYTSKTCTNCGTLNYSLGGSKVFSCSACKIVIDRDLNGARNILLRYLSSLDICI